MDLKVGNAIPAEGGGSDLCQIRPLLEDCGQDCLRLERTDS